MPAPSLSLFPSTSLFPSLSLLGLTVQRVSLAGLVVSFVPATVDGDSFPAGDHMFFVARNGSGGALRVVFDGAGRACSYGFAHPLTVSVAAGMLVWCGPLPWWRWGDVVAVSYPDGVGGLDVAAVAA